MLGRSRVGVICLTVAVALVVASLPHRSVGPEVLSVGPHRVARITNDGFLLLDNGAEVRLLGIFSTSLTRPALESRIGACSVELSFDRNRRDSAGRFLAYVYVAGACVNEQLIRAGDARVIRDSPYDDKRKKLFIQAEQEARLARRGVWAASALR